MKDKKIYIVGIGGIGNSALAQLFLHEGAEVLGSDRSDSITTHLLREKGISVFIGHSGAQLPEDTTMLVYSDAIPTDNPERVRGRELGIPELSYFEALGKAAEGKRVVAVSGTHGKTTTTAMIGKILVDAGVDPTVVVGSIVSEWKSNFRAGASDIFVVEACEYKRHFLTFHPEVLVITNIEFDHTDYFKNVDDVVSAFGESIQSINEIGAVVTNVHSETIHKALQGREGVGVVDYTTQNVPELLVPGEFNADNARAAKAAVHVIAPQVSDVGIDRSLKNFTGTWRRFEYKGVLPGGAVLYDDYAHHPTAIEKTIAAAKERFPNKKVVVFFHPHLYSRTRDLFDDFAQALVLADEVYILPVYAAREEHDPSVSNEALAAAVNKNGHAIAVSGMEETTTKLKELGDDVVAFTMGAGDVYRAGEAALK